MRNESPLAYIAAGCNQVAYVVKDINAGMKFFNEHLGVGRFFLFEDFQAEDKTYRGAPGVFQMHLAIGYAGQLQIELIQHLSGESIFKEFLNSKGEGMHHLQFVVDDYEKALSDFAKNGYPVIQSGRLGDKPGTRFAFFDTEEVIGSIMEIITLDSGTKDLMENIKQGQF